MFVCHAVPVGQRKRVCKCSATEAEEGILGCSDTEPEGVGFGCRAIGPEDVCWYALRLNKGGSVSNVACKDQRTCVGMLCG